MTAAPQLTFPPLETTASGFVFKKEEKCPPLSGNKRKTKRGPMLLACLVVRPGGDLMGLGDRGWHYPLSAKMKRIPRGYAGRARESLQQQQPARTGFSGHLPLQLPLRGPVRFQALAVRTGHCVGSARVPMSGSQLRSSPHTAGTRVLESLPM